MQALPLDGLLAQLLLASDQLAAHRSDLCAQRVLVPAAGRELAPDLHQLVLGSQQAVMGLDQRGAQVAFTLHACLERSPKRVELWRALLEVRLVGHPRSGGSHTRA